LLFNDKYRRLFSPTDFDLVISDEAHRSIGGNARAVFEYFVGYKLGLTTTPRDYLKKHDTAKPSTRDPRETERRLLLDTYRTFGCDSGQPTFRYSLLDGVRDGFLINPVVVDARTDVTTQLLSDKGYAVASTAENSEIGEENFFQKDFEKKFFSDATNRLFCQTFLKNGLRDPTSHECGKSIVFAVSQNHAAELAQILNELADVIWPGKYQSDFAVQVTSQIPDAQQYTINGARQVVENYQPRVDVLPDWPIAELGSLCGLSSGGTPSKANASYWEGTVPWVSVKDMKTAIIGDATLHISEAAVAESATRIAPAGSLLVLVRGMGLANGVPICELAVDCAFNQDIKAIHPKADVTSAFLRLSLVQQQNRFAEILGTAGYGTLKIDTGDLLKIQIALPDLDTQRAIVAEI